MAGAQGTDRGVRREVISDQEYLHHRLCSLMLRIRRRMPAGLLMEVQNGIAARGCREVAGGATGGGAARDGLSGARVEPFDRKRAGGGAQVDGHRTARR